MRIRYILSLLVLAFAGIVFLFWLYRQNAGYFGSPLLSDSVSVNLVGRTNDPAGTTIYIFEATNAAPRSWRVSYQTQLLQGSTAYPPKSQQKLWVFDAPLPARSALRFAFPVPAEASTSWRAVLFYDNPPAAWRTRVNSFARRLGATKRVVDEFPRKFAYSEDIPKL